MKTIGLVLLLVVSAFAIGAQERKVDKTYYTVQYFRDIKYRGYQIQVNRKIRNDYSIGISFTHAMKQNHLPAYIIRNINPHDTPTYNVVRIIDVVWGKYINLTSKGNVLLCISAGPSYSNFQNKVNYLPFNCNLIYDTEITKALGLALNSTIHVHTRYKIGLDLNAYCNLNTEKVLLGLGIGMRFGRMTQ
jgi:hypothetical protein